jgi:RecA/RadA recombinase
MTSLRVAVPAGEDPAGQHSHGSSSAARALRPKAVPASQVKARPVDWLWPGRVPTGLFTYLAGEPGLGKSLLSLELVARLSRGDLSGTAGNSLLLTAEDSREHTVIPRLQAAGADLDRVFFPPLEEDGVDQAIRLPDDLTRLHELVSQVEARLVVIDPLVAHLPERINSWQDQSVRSALAPLHRLAEESGAAFLLVGHLNKGQGNKPLQRIGGSIAIPAAARSVLLLARDPSDPQGEDGPRRVLAHVKSNVGVLSSSIAFVIEPVLLSGPPAIATARLHEQGQSPFTGAELLREPEPRSAPKLEQAKRMLEEELASGPKRVVELQAQAGELDISPSTLDRAKADLGVGSNKLGVIDGWVWLLPATDHVAGDAGE